MKFKVDLCTQSTIEIEAKDCGEAARLANEYINKLYEANPKVRIDIEGIYL